MAGNRTLTASVQAQIAGPVTYPGLLVEMAYSTIIRLSTRGDVSWSGLVWSGGRIGKITPVDGGSLEVLDGDEAYSALALAEQAADVRVRVWGISSDTPAEADPVLLFDGSLNGAQRDDNTGRVRFGLSTMYTRTQFSPRLLIGPGTGFNHLTPSGKRLTWGGQTIILERQ